MLQAASAQAAARSLTRHRSLPRPAFGSSPNLQVRALGVDCLAWGRFTAAGSWHQLQAEDVTSQLHASQALVVEAEERDRSSADATFYEITIASVDQPRLLCRLSESLVSLLIKDRVQARKLACAFYFCWGLFGDGLFLSPSQPISSRLRAPVRGSYTRTKTD